MRHIGTLAHNSSVGRASRRQGVQGQTLGAVIPSIVSFLCFRGMSVDVMENGK